MKYPHTEAIDRAIIDGYRGDRSRGFSIRIAKSVARPIAYIKNRAVVLGVANRGLTHQPWSAEEDDLLERFAHVDPVWASRKMRKAGFSRTPTAIAVRRKQKNLMRMECRADAGIYTASQLAGFMGVHPTRVGRWINKGWLKAQRMGTARQPETGDYWAIKTKDVRRFIIDNTAQVEIHLCDKFWLVDLLSRGQSGSGTDKISTSQNLIRTTHDRHRKQTQVHPRPVDA